MSQARETLVAARGLATGYDRSGPVIEGVTFVAGAGETIAVLGPNGGGKTTLFRALLGELRPLAGGAWVNGRPAYVPQIERTRLDFPVSALDVVLMGAWTRLPWYRRSGPSERVAAERALDRVGLLGRAAAPFGALSGGERQRALVARALAQEADVVLLDEPLSGVDRTSAARVLAVLDELREEGRAVLVATHDADYARSLDAVLCLNRRQMAFGPPAATLDRAVLEATYGPEIIVLEEGQRAVAVDHHAHQ
jgi:ABC-type Mn2+/Zn2+ transport system ATPase subunit